MLRDRISCALTLLALATAAQAAGDDTQPDLEKILQSAKQYVPARVIERKPPRYPRHELSRGYEAWVHVAYCIDEAGQTRNISVLDSVGGPRFDQAAIHSVENWKFEPALVAGSPTWQSRNQAYITFALKDKHRAADRKFVKTYRKLGKLLDEEKLEEADELFRKVHETYNLSLYELSKLWAQRVRYEALTGDMHGLNRALYRATASNGEWIEKKDYHRLLNLSAQVEVQLGKYHAANETFEELVESAGEDSEEVTSLQPIMARLNSVIHSDKPFRIEAAVAARDDCESCSSRWSFTPVHNTFALMDISGTLTSVEMRCDHKRFESSVSEKVEWTIPESWGSCHVSFRGDPGTTFAVVSIPPSS